MTVGDGIPGIDAFVQRPRDRTDQPPCGPRWLEAHHLAKLAERRRFAERLAALAPRTVLDVGCGPGLWLDLLHDLLPDDCSFVGVDIDEELLDIARQRSRRWPQQVRFEVLDVETEAAQLPVADLTLLCNVMSYVSQPLDLLTSIAARRDGSSVAIREGASLRFGPMPAGRFEPSRPNWAPTWPSTRPSACSTRIRPTPPSPTPPSPTVTLASSCSSAPLRSRRTSRPTWTERSGGR